MVLLTAAKFENFYNCIAKRLMGTHVITLVTLYEELYFSVN